MVGISIRGAAACAVTALAVSFPTVAPASVVFSSGPTNGTISAYTMNYGTQMSAKFTLSQAAVVTGVIFGAWVDGGAANPVSVDWSIGTAFFDGSIGAGTAALSGTFHNQAFNYYDVYDETFSVGSLSLGPGTYYLTLTRSDSPTTAMYWDIASYNCCANAAQGSAGQATNDVSFTLLSDPASNSTPEPGSLGIVALGLLLSAAAVRRRG